MLPERTGSLKQLMQSDRLDRAVESITSGVVSDSFKRRNCWFHAVKLMVSKLETKVSPLWN